jgi:hypothetical protein
MVGDGTTSVILLTAELLRQAQVLVSSRGIHPARIIHVRSPYTCLTIIRDTEKRNNLHP